MAQSCQTDGIPPCWTRYAAALLLAFVIVSGVLHAQTIQLSIPDTAARRGDTLLVPIRVSALTLGDSVYAGQITYSYNSGVIQVFNVETAGTLLQGLGSVQFSRTNNRIAFALTSPLAGSGVLIYLRVAVAISPTSTLSALGFTAAQLNEGRPVVTTTNGSLRILAIALSPKNPPTNLVEGDSLQFSVSGDVRPPVLWSTSDTNVATIDSTGKMRALRRGQLKVFVADAQGLRDSTNLFLINSPLLRSLTVRIRDTSHTQTLSFNLPIYVSDVTGLGIFSAQFSLTYNGAILIAVDVLTSGTMSAGWGAPTFHSTAGRVEVALAGEQALSGAGILAYVRFRVAANAVSSTTISFANVRFNEDINANEVSGTFTPRAAPLLVLSPSSAVLTKGDTLRLSVVSGGTPPYAWTSNNPLVLSVDRLTGLISALSRGSTTVSVTDSFGFSATSGSITVNDVRVKLADTTVGRNDSVDVSLLVDDITGLGVLSFQTRIGYDSKMFRFVRLLNTGTLSGQMEVTYRDTLDTLRIAAGGSQWLSGRGILLKLRFVATDSARVGTTMPLRFTQFEFNEPAAGTATATRLNGSITVVAEPAAPLLVAPVSGALDVVRRPVLQWQSVAGVWFYHLQLSRDSTFATTAHDTSGIIDTTVVAPLLEADTRYYWRLRARNAAGFGPYSAIFSFTTGTRTSVELLPKELPSGYVLEQNYPNPFNPTTAIVFEIARTERVRLSVYSLLGQHLENLVDETLPPGRYQVRWTAEKFKSGVYFYRLTAGNYSAARKLILLR